MNQENDAKVNGILCESSDSLKSCYSKDSKLHALRK